MTVHPPSPSFLQHSEWSLLLFGGKGGVGKTTCAAATALYLARQFPLQPFLLVSTDPAHSLRDCLGGPSPAANLQYREIDFRESLERFRQAHARHLRAIALEGTFLDAEDVNPLLDLSLPGFDELMAFHELALILESGAPPRIIIDTAPSGHTLRLLELPGLLRQWLDALDALRAKHRYLARLYCRTYRKDEIDLFLEGLAASTERLAALLRDPKRCLFIPVMLPETLSRQETRRLVARLQELQVPVGDILVNRLYPAETSCARCRAVHGRQQGELRRALAELAGHPLWGIPLQGGEASGPESLARFFDHLEALTHAAEVTRVDSAEKPQVDLPARLPSAGAVLILFTGKGGVGKTTLACASALALSRAYPGRRLLLFSTDPAHSLADCLDRPVGPAEVEIVPGLFALEIDSAAEFERLKHTYLEEVEALFDTLLNQGGIDIDFDREVIERLLELAPPGLDEVMAVLRAVELLEARKYDTLVLDTSPTGHLVRLLDLPELMQDWLRAIFALFLKYKTVFRLPRVNDFLVGLSRKLKHFRSLLTDPRTGQLQVVSILTEMAREETCDLVAACRRAGLAVGALFLNLATPPGPCSLCRAVARTESCVRARFASTFADLPQTVVCRSGDPRGLERLTELGDSLYQASSQSPVGAKHDCSERADERVVLGRE